MYQLYDYFQQLYPLSDESWHRILPLFKEQSLKKGNHFIQEGQIAREIGFLTNGIIRAYYRNAEGNQYNKHFFTSPCFIGGYASLITGQPNQINQQALTDCMVLTANFGQFKALYSDHPDLESAARILAERFFVQKEQREIEIVLLDAEKRYQIFLREYPGLENRIPQYHIASYLGVTPTQLSRIRRKLAGR